MDPPTIHGRLLRIHQLTDSHLYAERGVCLNGIDTDASFRRTLALAVHPRAPDLLLLTGDIAQDGEPAAYANCQKYTRDTGIPTLWLPGNHDDPEVMETFASTSGACRYGNWLLIRIHTQIPGQEGGFLGAARLGQLAEILRATSASHILLAGHHHCRAVATPWIDKSRLADADLLHELLRRDGRTRILLSGHAHMAAETWVDNILYCVAPSTCSQFLPGSTNFALDDTQPGYRWVELHADGQVRTGVEWLASGTVAAARQGAADESAPEWNSSRAGESPPGRSARP